MSETAAVATEQEAISFEYTNLSDVDPKFKGTLVPEGDYKVEVVSAIKETYVLNAGHASVKKGLAEVGGEGVKLKFTLIVVDHDEFSGRRVFPVLFPSEVTKQQLRRIMDATGYQQEPGQSIYGWMEAMERQNPRLCFETRITVKDSRFKKDAEGNPEKENDVDFRVVKPASR